MNASIEQDAETTAHARSVRMNVPAAIAVASAHVEAHR
jgi:hypothetical protein